MSVIKILTAVVTAYLLGSLPSAVWAGRIFHGIDVREHGSGNAGATNVI
ncbi:MAG TPA: glycerol-3-phosphate acyltransferase, partial [Bacteroidales bacterium]|nr:glycerol-3-phosphate acyltransferase [Bacteroidales bacterium]